jgi:hypothetical protein
LFHADHNPNSNPKKNYTSAIETENKRKQNKTTFSMYHGQALLHKVAKQHKTKLKKTTTTTTTKLQSNLLPLTPQLSISCGQSDSGNLQHITY